MSDGKRRYDPTVFTTFVNRKTLENGEERVTVSMRPKLGKYGVKSITVELNDGTLIDLDDDSIFFANDPRDRIQYQMDKGSLSEDDGLERISKLDNANISRNVTLKLK